MGKKKSLVRLVLVQDIPYMFSECVNKFKELSFPSQEEINVFRYKEYKVRGRKYKITIEELGGSK